MPTYAEELREVGNSVGRVLPKEALTHFNVADGDSLCVTNAADPDHPGHPCRET